MTVDIASELAKKGYCPEEILSANRLDDFSEVKIAKDGSFRIKGLFLKGTTGNRGGKHILKSTDREAIDRVFKAQFAELDNEDSGDPYKVLKAAMIAATDPNQKIRLAQILLPYEMGRKQSVEIINVDQKRIEIVIGDPETTKLFSDKFSQLTGMPVKSIKDVTPEEE